MNRLRVLGLGALAIMPAFAQMQKNYAFTLPSDVAVLYQVYSEVTLGNQDRTVSQAEAKENRIRRVLSHSDGLPWLGFDVRVERLDLARIRVSVESIPGIAFFARKPADREVAPGARILLDVLVSPETGKKVFDTFQVGFNGSPMQIMPMPHSIPGLPGAGTVIQLANPRLQSGNETLASGAASMAGTRIRVVAKRIGRQLTFASAPAPGFRMEAIAEGKFIRFIDGNASYTLECDAPIVHQPGSWYLWVLAQSIPQEAGLLLHVVVP